jgi:hypothetical protein
MAKSKSLAPPPLVVRTYEELDKYVRAFVQLRPEYPQCRPPVSWPRRSVSNFCPMNGSRMPTIKRHDSARAKQSLEGHRRS